MSRVRIQESIFSKTPSVLWSTPAILKHFSKVGIAIILWWKKFQVWVLCLKGNLQSCLTYKYRISKGCDFTMDAQSKSPTLHQAGVWLRVSSGRATLHGDGHRWFLLPLSIPLGKEQSPNTQRQKDIALVSENLEQMGEPEAGCCKLEMGSAG